MLKQILSTMATGEVQTRSELAAVLDISEPLLSQMISQLMSQGYLTRASMCADGCEGCSLHMRCDPDRGLLIWTLTEKGRRAVSI